MDVTVVSGGRPTGQRRQQIVSGYVSHNQPAPAAFTDPLYVIVPSHSDEIPITFEHWPVSHGHALPAAGTSVTVGYREDGTPRILEWDGPNT